jgi:dihydrofolate reductase
MRNLIVTENITVDGVNEAAEGWVSAAGGQEGMSDVETALRTQRGAADALLLGRVTFEQMRGYWPLQTTTRRGITDYLKDISKYVVSSTPKGPGRERTSVLRSVDEIRALKSETGADIVTTGSIRLVRELIAAGLVDEYRLFAYPVVIGRGQRLFADTTEVSPAFGGEPALPLRRHASALSDSLTRRLMRRLAWFQTSMFAVGCRNRPCLPGQEGAGEPRRPQE